MVNQDNVAMRKDSFNRLTALLEGKHVDRVPLFPLHLHGFSAKNIGYPFSTMYTEPEMSFFAQLWTQQHYGFEPIPTYNYASYGAWEFGGEVKFPSGQYEQAPSIVRYPILSEEDVERIESNGLPDVSIRGCVPLNMEFSKLQEKHGLPITFLCGSPFTRAVNVCGPERLLRWVIKKPDLAHRVVRLVTDHLLKVACYWVDIFGADRLLPYSGNPFEANQVISPRNFEEFAFPYAKELNQKVLAMGIKRFQFHICGEQNMNLPLLAKIPLGENGIVSVGNEIDLDIAVKYFGESSIIVGNIQPSIIQMGAPQEVYEVARQCIEKGKRAPRGFMLASGCELPPLSPPYHVYLMSRAVDDFGSYE